jgi:FkbM family methyltransferase
MVDPHEYIGQVVTLCGEYDPKIGTICRRVLRPGDAVLDIGANYGIESLISAIAVGPTGLVHAFEPQPRLAEMIRASAAHNRLPNITVHEVALSDRDAMMELLVPEQNRSAARLIAEPTVADDAHSGITVRAVAADAYLRSLDLPSVRLLKIDVEGHEGVILRNAKRYLADAPPAVIVFESHTRPGSFHDRPEVRVMASLGYEFLQLEKRLFGLALRDVRSTGDLLPGSYDFVAVHSDPPGRDALRALQA